MKKRILTALIAGAITGCALQAQAQGTPVALAPSEYQGHPQKIPADPGAYTAPDTSEFGIVPQGVGVLFTQWQRGDLLEPSDANDGYAARKFVKDSSSNGPAYAVDSNSYFYFYAVLQPGYTLTLSEITWKVRRSGTGPKYAQWQYAAKSGGYVFQDMGSMISVPISGATIQTVIISPAPSITLDGGSAGDSVMIRVLVWGASGANGTLRIANGTSFNGTVLPLTLLSFTAQVQHQQAVLSWETAKESNVRGFEVESSSDARDFKRIGFIPAKNGMQNSYRFTETLPAGKTFYRLKMTDLDGTFSYSPVQRLYSEGQAAVVALYPNPAQQVLTVTGVGKDVRLFVYDLQGRLVKEAIVTEEKSGYDLNIQSLPPGFYTLRVVNAEEACTMRFVKK